MDASREDPPIFVHATNITGLGAAQVARSIIEALLVGEEGPRLDCWVPTVGPLAGIGSTSPRAEFHRFRRKLPNSVSRLLECRFSGRYFPPASHGITLGDVPLGHLGRQVVLAHQPHLTSPRINPNASGSFNSRMLRQLFRRNLRHADHLVVQTGVVEEELLASYPELEGRVAVIPQPPPIWFRRRLMAEGRGRPVGGPLRLFYPAAGYPHKNHRLLARMAAVGPPPASFGEMVITLRPEETSGLDLGFPWLRNVGRLDPDACLAAYGEVDALFFPSTAESYGLPLVEAMVLGLPIVAADLPYARWLCEDQALLFDPFDPHAAWLAIAELVERRRSGWHPDYRRALAKLPRDWGEVAEGFLELLSC